MGSSRCWALGLGFGDACGCLQYVGAATGGALVLGRRERTQGKRAWDAVSLGALVACGVSL